VLVVCHGVQLIVIGNGTVLCETDVLVIELIVDVKVAGVTVLIKVMVSEAGVLVYLVSVYVAYELLIFDVIFCGAVSIVC
ncbi:MAG: hypothetical protein O7C59_08210, partial [Rickettsia endosymbiont of Ixodes persulcatus]|nr:hypothetical protein [Rickettsia endosymbiont of Ixodes persulcatus]